MQMKLFPLAPVKKVKKKKTILNAYFQGQQPLHMVKIGTIQF